MAKETKPPKKQWPKEEDFEKSKDKKDKKDVKGTKDLEGGKEGEEIRGILEHPSYIELEKKLTEAEAKANEYWNQALRAQADLDNLRRRAERDVSSAHKYALEKFVADVLPVVDSLDRALQSNVDNNELAKKIHEGIELTMNLFLKTLSKHQVKQIDPLGEAFNPELHQAISTQPSDEYETNTVIEVLQKGYMLNDRLVRPALVVVAS